MILKTIGWSTKSCRPTWVSMTIQALSVAVLFGCGTRILIEDIDKPFGVVRATVKEILPGGIRKTSDNGREFDSNYFAPKGPLDVDAASANFRETAKLVILGAGRPYTVSIDTFIEKKSGKAYEAYGRDPGRAKEIARRFETSLSKRRDDRNMIDDFKPF